MLQSLSKLGAVMLVTFAVGLPALAQDVASQSAPNDVQSSREEVRKEVRESLSTIKAYSAEKRTEAIKESQEALDRLDDRLEVMEEKMKERNQLMIRELKEDRAELARYFQELKAASKESWEQVKADFVTAYQKLEKKLAGQESLSSNEEEDAIIEIKD